MNKLIDEINLYKKAIKDRSDKLFLDDIILRGLKEQLQLCKNRKKENEKSIAQMKENNKSLGIAMDKIKEENQ